MVSTEILPILNIPSPPKLPAKKGFFSSFMNGTRIYDGASSIGNKMKDGMILLNDIPNFYKLSFLFLFFYFFYRIFYDIAIFFGFNEMDTYLYLAWIALIMLLSSFLQPNRSILYI